jgi:hypothetical protein
VRFEGLCLEPREPILISFLRHTDALSPKTSIGSEEFRIQKSESRIKRNSGYVLF